MTNSVSSYFVGVPGGLVMSLIAFSIVFIVIIGLMLVMMATGRVCSAIDDKKSGKGGKGAGVVTTQAQAPTQPQVATASAPAQAVAAQDDGELIAVISAAVAALCGATARVVSFAPAKAPAASAWRNVGRLQNAEGF